MLFSFEKFLKVFLFFRVGRNDLKVLARFNCIQYFFLVAVEFEIFEVLPDGGICFLVFFQDFPQDEAFLVLSGPEEIGLTVHFYLVEVELVEKKAITSAYVKQLDVGVVASVDLLAHLMQEGLVRDLQFAEAVPAPCRGGGRGGLFPLLAAPVEEGRKETSLFLLLPSVLREVFFFFDEDSEEFFVIEYFFSHIQDVFEYFCVLVGTDSEVFLVAVEDYLVGESRDSDHLDICDGDLLLEVVVVDEVKSFTADGQPIAVLVIGAGEIHDRHHIQKHFPGFQFTTHHLHTFLLHSAELQINIRQPLLKPTNRKQLPSFLSQ